jgi:hypothetical protein
MYEGEDYFLCNVFEHVDFFEGGAGGWMQFLIFCVVVWLLVFL